MLGRGVDSGAAQTAEPEVVSPAVPPQPQPPRLSRNLPGVLALPAAWAASGALVGLAVSLVLGWPAQLVVLAVVVVAGLSWLARGLGPLVATSMLWLAALALFLQTAAAVLPSAVWDFGWLVPLCFVAVGASLLAGRLAGVGWPERSPGRAAAVDLVAAVVALGWALYAARILSANAGAQAVRLLIQREDNAAWVNTVASLGQHGATASTATSFDTFGPVITTLLGMVRQAVGVGSPNVLAPGLDAQAVVAAHALMILAVPLVTAVVARRVMGQPRNSVTFLMWATTGVVTTGFCLVFASYGFLSASLATLLVLVAAWAASERPARVDRWRPLLGWLVVSLLVYGAAASWVAIVPLGGIVLAAWAAALLVRAGRRRAALPLLVAAGFCLPALLMELALLRQYRSVIGPVGGSSALLAAGAGTPIINSAFLAVALALLVLGWLASPAATALAPVRPTPLVRSVLWLAAYLVPIGLVEGVATTGAAHYGSQKLLYVFSGIWVTLAVADLLASQRIARRGLDVSLSVVVAVLVAATVVNGPLYTAAQSHWPRRGPAPKWLAPAQLAVAGGGFVECLSTQPPAHRGSRASSDAYVCSRWSASLGGQDGAVALTWRFVMLGIQPVQDAVADIRAHQHLGWKVLVIGPTDGLCDPAAWWAPIVAQPGIELLGVPGTAAMPPVSPTSTATNPGGTVRLSCPAG